MRAAITLVMFNGQKPMHWDFGKVYAIGYTTTSLLDIRNDILQDASEYILFWDLELGDIPVESIDEITKSSGDLWHVGPRLGTQNAIELLDFIQPTNMLHLNVDTSINHSIDMHARLTGLQQGWRIRVISTFRHRKTRILGPPGKRDENATKTRSRRRS